MPHEVIDRVHTLACHSKASRTLQFTWCDGTPIEGVTYGESYDTNDDGYEYTASDDDESDNENTDDDNDVDDHDDDDNDHAEHENENYDNNENENPDASDNTTGIAGVINDNEEENDDKDDEDPKTT